jgi:alpha-acetolactate decarboxylase
MLEPDTYFMGTLSKGMLDGTFVVRSPKYHIYSQTSMNHIQGEVVVIDRQNKRARVWEIIGIVLTIQIHKAAASEKASTMSYSVKRRY